MTNQLTRWAGPAQAFNLLALLDAGIKGMRHPMVEETMRQLGFNGGLGFPSGIIEAVCLMLFWMRRTVMLITGLFVWSGLRDPLLRALFPLRRMAG